jgi:hypothetical protein
MREWYGAFPDCGPLAEDSATKLKRGQLNVCTVYGVLFSPLRLKFVPDWPEICTRLARNLYQIGRQFISVVDKSKVWGI